MQFVVQQIGARAIAHGSTGSNHDIIVDRKDYVKGYHTSLTTAEQEAKAKASATPGTQWAVLGVLKVFETTKPNFIEKVVNDAGELVIKPAETV